MLLLFAKEGDKVRPDALHRQGDDEFRAEALHPGVPLELRHEEGWWQVRVAKQAHADDCVRALRLPRCAVCVARQVNYVSRRVGTDSVLVKSTHWGSEHLTELSQLRPGWRWSPSSNEWVKGMPGGRDRAGPGHGRGRGRGGVGAR